MSNRTVSVGRLDGRIKGDLTFLSWGPWIGSAAGAGVIINGGMGTVFGMELRGASVVVLLAAVVSWVVARQVVDEWTGTRLFLVLGTVIFTPVAIQTLRLAGREDFIWLPLAFVGAVLLAGGSRVLFTLLDGSTGLGYLGGFVVFAQAFDATTTAVGVDVLGYGEQTPSSEFVLTITTHLPSTELTGIGWVYVLLKVVLALSIVALLRDDTGSIDRSFPLAIVAFAGFGPAVHNVVLFATT